MSQATTTPTQLSLLADHISLSLLDRQRAVALSLPTDSTTAELSRSLDSFRTGLEALEASPSPQSTAQLPALRKQYAALLHQFDGSAPPEPTPAPNDPSLQPAFDAEQRALRKSVRFSDSPATHGAYADDPSRAQLFTSYADDPSRASYRDEDDAPDHSALSNQQVHAYHSTALREQDAQLDVLGRSLGRQRDLSIQIGSELDEQGGMLDDVDGAVDRHQGQIDRARRRVEGVARKAKDNWSLVTIGVLVLILVLLIVVLK